MEILVTLCSDVISSRIFAPGLTGEADPVAAMRALARLGPERVAMTFGEAGCLALIGDRPEHVPAFAVPVQDTTGAGDAFHAGYAVARAENRGWREALVFASAVAALKCRSWGGRRGLPDREEVEQLLREGRPRSERPPFPAA
jgi:sugar/nucleoside kinase (ribokinase family)